MKACVDRVAAAAGTGSGSPPGLVLVMVEGLQGLAGRVGLLSGDAEALRADHTVLAVP